MNGWPQKHFQECLHMSKWLIFIVHLLKHVIYFVCFLEKSKGFNVVQYVEMIYTKIIAQVYIKQSLLPLLFINVMANKAIYTYVYVIFCIDFKPLQHYVISARLLPIWVYYLRTDLI